MNASHLGRASRALLQSSIPPVTPNTIKQLRELHPARKCKLDIPKLPATAPKVIVVAEDLRKLVTKHLRNGSAPGPSGWTGDLISYLVEDDEILEAIALIVSDMIDGRISDSSRKLLTACTLMGIDKKDEKTGKVRGVRPIAISDAFYRLAVLYVVSLCEVKLQFAKSSQFGVGKPGGSERAFLRIMTAVEEGKDFVVLKTDFKNAFNAQCRVQGRNCERGLLITAIRKDVAILRLDLWNAE